MIKILYVHGYKGDKYGPSFQRLAKYADAANFGGEKVELLSFDYDPEEPTKSIRELRLYYYAHDIDLIIGSSLGGFLAACCPWTRRIVINPCWSPSVELPKAGYEGLTDDYAFREDSLGMYAGSGDERLCIGCFAKQDELLGHKYRPKFRKFYKETYDVPGGHCLSEAAAKKIMTEIAPMLIARFKSRRGLGHIVRKGLSMQEKLVFAHLLSMRNDPAVNASEKCGCFWCERIFPATEVRECYRELGNGLTAICPYCGIDAVLADASGVEVSPEFLHKMHKAWFE